MKLTVFASAWSYGSVQACRAEVESGAFDGIESPVPRDSSAVRALRTELTSAGIPWLAEVCTGGNYAPASSVPFAVHLSELEAQVQRAAEGGALLASCLAGSDSWPVSQAVDFYGQAMLAGQRAGIELTFETHRSRPTFNPWSTRDILRALPQMQLTCDFSHWCVVCERLLADETDETDEAALSLAISRARHVHARVGYAQGPQVPDPRATEFNHELVTHERWWTRIWDAAESRALEGVSMTPEFGPDGYLHHLPYTNVPVADLGAINRYMAHRQKQRFADRTRETRQLSPH